MKLQQVCIVLSAAALTAACGVERRGDSTGGVAVEANLPELRGFAVVGSDFTSTSISLLSTDGEVQSSSFISSASGTPGLSAALSGDVVLPSSRLPGDELLLIDRFPSPVLTWVDLETAAVRAQLSVASGFSSNPHDYVPYSATKAFVTRFEPNLMSGVMPFDGGDDVLIVDPNSAEITGRIDLTAAFPDAGGGFHPRADHAFLAGGKLRVLALGLNLDFTDQLASRLISVDPETNAIDDVLVFEGMSSCGNARISPDATELAIACNGGFGPAPADGYQDSGVLLVSVDDAPEELVRWTAADMQTSQVNNLAWLDEQHVVLLTFGRFGTDTLAAEADDAVLTLDLGDGSVSGPWLSAGPFSLGDVVCSTKDQVCLVADAETEGGVVQRLSIEDDGTLSVTGRIAPDPASGLPPRSFGTY